MSSLDNNDLVVNVILGPVEPNNRLIGRNPFISPEYWLSKGYKIQKGLASHGNTGKRGEAAPSVSARHGKAKIIDMSDHALDYYYQGIRIHSRHFGCCFNIATIFLRKNKYKNAQKWFQMATKLNRESKEAYLGLAISSLKLGQHEFCIQQIDQRPGQQQGKSRKDKSQHQNSMAIRTQRSSIGESLPKSSDGPSSRSRSMSLSRATFANKNGSSNLL